MQLDFVTNKGIMQMVLSKVKEYRERKGDEAGGSGPVREAEPKRNKRNRERET